MRDRVLFNGFWWGTLFAYFSSLYFAIERNNEFRCSFVYHSGRLLHSYDFGILILTVVLR